MKTIDQALEYCANARTALDDPGGLPDEDAILNYTDAGEVKAYAIDQLDQAINLLLELQS